MFLYLYPLPYFQQTTTKISVIDTDSSTSIGQLQNIMDEQEWEKLTPAQLNAKRGQRKASLQDCAICYMTELFVTPIAAVNLA